MVLIVGVVFAVFGFLFIAVILAMIGLNRDKKTSLGISGNVIIAAFGLLFAGVAYWSGSWLFSTSKESSSPRQELSEDYLGEWRSDAPGNIIRTLISNHVRGCGEFHYKFNPRISGEYLVYCTDDGQNWAAYLVWPNVDRISGPARPDPNIRPPR